MSQSTILNNLLVWLSKKISSEQSELVQRYFEDPDELSFEETEHMELIAAELRFRQISSPTEELIAESTTAGLDNEVARKLVERLTDFPSLRRKDIRALAGMSLANFEWTVSTTISFFLTRRFEIPPPNINPAESERKAVFRVIFRMTDIMISLAVEDDEFRKVFAQESLAQDRIDLICSKVKKNLTPIRHVLSYHMLQGVSASNIEINKKLNEISKELERLSDNLENFVRRKD